MQEQPNCPIDCPNRKKETQTVRAGAYVFALLTSIFLTAQCISYERRGQETPVAVWFPSLLLIGGALGVNVDPASLTTLLKR